MEPVPPHLAARYPHLPPAAQIPPPPPWVLLQAQQRRQEPPAPPTPEAAPSESAPETEEPEPEMLDEWPMSGAETAAPPQSEAEALCAALSGRDDLRRAPDVIDAALELLQKWLQRRRAGAAAISFVTRADAGADGQRELSLRVAGAGFAEPLPAGDEVPATLSLLRSGRKSLLIEDGGFIASHFGRAAKRRSCKATSNNCPPVEPYRLPVM